MNKQLKLALTAIAAAATFTSGAAFAVDGTGTANATVIVPISISETASLEFGKFTKAAGVITMAPDGTRTGTGPLSALSTVTPGRAGAMTVSGDPDATYTVSALGGTLTDGTNNMTLNGMVVTTAAATGVPITTGLLDGTGVQALKIGANLTVDANQASGNYSGNYTVSVDYN